MLVTIVWSVENNTRTGGPLDDHFCIINSKKTKIAIDPIRKNKNKLEAQVFTMDSLLGENDHFVILDSSDKVIGKGHVKSSYYKKYKKIYDLYLNLKGHGIKPTFRYSDFLAYGTFCIKFDFSSGDYYTYIGDESTPFLESNDIDEPFYYSILGYLIDNFKEPVNMFSNN